MNAAAWQQHLQNVALKADIRRLELVITDLRQRPRCVYCGTLTNRRDGSCHAHADLPAMDVGYHA